MSFPSLRTICRTLRFRLTLWNMAALLILLVTTLLAVRRGLQLTIAELTDGFIEEEGDSAVVEIGQRLGPPEALHEELNRRALAHPRRRLFFQLFDAAGSLQWSSAQAPLSGLPPWGAALDALRTADNHRFTDRWGSQAGTERLGVRTGCSLNQAQRELDLFTRILVGMGLLTLVVVPLGSYLLAGRATRPFARIIATAERLDPSHLRERLPLTGTHDELDRLSQTINGFLDRLAAYLQQSSEFTANAAHELRSPLTALQSSLEVALNTDRSVEEYKEVLAVVLEECNNLRLLVNQLLLLAEGDAGRLRQQAEAVRLDQLVLSSVEMFQVVAEAGGVTLAARHKDPVTIHGVGNRLWQVVNNLIDNAVKFTPAGGTVTVDLRLDPAQHEAILEVADTGMGVSPQDLPHIFERFYQGDRARQRDNRSRGVGLGLSICKAVVAAHGGTIALASTPGAGTTVTVRLPGAVSAGSGDGKTPPPFVPEKSGTERRG